MNSKLVQKMQQRLVALEHQASEINNQISDLSNFKGIENNLRREQLETDLKDTLSRIEHINAANKHFSCC